MESPERPRPTIQSGQAVEESVIDVATWFTDRREVVLELNGVRYRLRLTRRNKLILQK